MAEHEHLALVLRQPRERLAKARERSKPRCSWPSSSTRTSSTGSRDGAHVVDRQLCATRRIQAENGTSRGSYLRIAVMSSREDVLRDVLSLVLVANDAAHEAVDVVGVADVQVAEGILIALLGACDDPVSSPASVLVQLVLR